MHQNHSKHVADDALFVGLDFGTSGVRASIVDTCGKEQANTQMHFVDHGSDLRDPALWWQVMEKTLGQILSLVDRGRVVAIAIDGTSGTVLPVDETGMPLAKAVMYNDPCKDDTILLTIARHAPADSAAHGASSALARAMALVKQSSREARPYKLLHQADWIASRFSGQFVSDENNALKTGYDPKAGVWPDWISKCGFDIGLLPDVKPAGCAIGPVTQRAAAHFNLPTHVQIVTGTTDGCASFLATGAAQTGDGVTALGTNLTLKILSDTPVFAAQYGIYSHRLLGRWLAGGSSNSGGGVLLDHFSTDEMAALSELIDPTRTTGLDYYPLSRPGERFPVADASHPPRLDPRPAEDYRFFQAMLEGIAGVEALGFERLRALGGPSLKSMRTVGGGARNSKWRDIRKQRLNVPFLEAVSTDASYGTALLAKRGAKLV